MSKRAQPAHDDEQPTGKRSKTAGAGGVELQAESELSGLADLTHEDILALVDAAPRQPCTVTDLDVASVVRALSRVRRAFDDNVKARSLHELEPVKFMPSEAELHDATTALADACSSPLLCSALLSAGAMSVLSSVLLHDNADLGNAAVGVCGELLDDDTLRELEPEAVQHSMQQLVSSGCLSALLHHACTLSESAGEDSAVIGRVLEVCEGCVDVFPALCVDLCRCPSFLPLVWRYADLSRQPVVANGVSAVELLCVCLSQEHSISVQCADLVDSGDGMLRVVKAIARYRRVEVEGQQEAEMCENVFQVLCQLLALSPPAACQLSFGRCDGVLALLAVLSRRSGPARFAALRALSFASQHQPEHCGAAVDNGAVKLIFALLSHTVSAYLQHTPPR